MQLATQIRYCDVYNQWKANASHKDVEKAANGMKGRLRITFHEMGPSYISFGSSTFLLVIYFRCLSCERGTLCRQEYGKNVYQKEKNELLMV